MKTYQILYDCGMNENSTSAASPKALWENQVDLNTTVLQCVSADFDQLVERKRYYVKDITLPDWLPVEHWLRNCISWSYFWAVPKASGLPEKWQMVLVHWGDNPARDGIVRLLSTKNFRSGYRKSLYDQCESWINNPDRKYDSPLSSKQMETLIDRPWVTKNRSSYLYYAHRYSSIGGIPV